MDCPLCRSAECRDDIDDVAATMAAIDDLPLLEPSAATSRALHRRVARARLRETLVSAHRWSVAGVIGGLAALVMLVLECGLPYAAVAAACARIVSTLLPTPAAYVLAGLAYSTLPLCLIAFAQARQRGPGVSGLVQTPAVFAAVMVGFGILDCADFPASFLAGLLGGLVIGAFAGAAAGTWLARRTVAEPTTAF